MRRSVRSEGSKRRNETLGLIRKRPGASCSLPGELINRTMARLETTKELVVAKLCRDGEASLVLVATGSGLASAGRTLAPPQNRFSARARRAARERTDENDSAEVWAESGGNCSKLLFGCAFLKGALPLSAYRPKPRQRRTAWHTFEPARHGSNEHHDFTALFCLTFPRSSISRDISSLLVQKSLLTSLLYPPFLGTRLLSRLPDFRHSYDPALAHGRRRESPCLSPCLMTRRSRISLKT